MNCPVCKDVKLLISERQGIEIDYCPECRGVWLDRGELDKIIEKSIPVKSSDYQKREHLKESYNNNYPYKKNKRESFLSDLFDF